MTREEFYEDLKQIGSKTEGVATPFYNEKLDVPVYSIALRRKDGKLGRRYDVFIYKGNICIGFKKFKETYERENQSK